MAEIKWDRKAVLGAAIALGLALYGIRSDRQERRLEHEAARSGDPLGHLAQQPAAISRRGWWAILKRVWTRLGEDNVGIMAAGVGFYALLSIFPGLTTLVSIYGLIANPHEVQQFVTNNQGLLPPEARRLITGQLSSLASAGSSKLGLGLVISLLFALWSTNYGTSTLIGALNVAYQEKEKRSYLVVTLVSLGLTLALILFGIVALLLVAVLPAVIGFMPIPEGWRETVYLVRWPILVLAVAIAIAALYRFAPSREQARWRWVSWGAAFATIAWIAASLGFSFYVSNFSSYDKTYGSLGAVVVLMMWFYLSAYVVLVGAELDAEMEHQTARDTTTGAPLPMGQRGARMADTVAET